MPLAWSVCFRGSARGVAVKAFSIVYPQLPGVPSQFFTQPMKSSHVQRYPVLSNKLLAAVLAFSGSAGLLSPVAHAASGSWLGATDSLWSDVSNWSASPVPGAGEVATFDGAGNGNTTIDLGAGVTIGSVVFDTADAVAYTIGSGAVGSQTLTFGAVGGAITMNSTVAANQLFNSNLALAVTTTANNAATYYTVTNNSLTNSLTLAGGISASSAGVKTLRVTGGGNTSISGAITSGSGNVSIFKTGSGTLTLSGGGTFSGAGITDGAGFTTSAVFREGLTILNGGTYGNSGGELVIGGVATNGGVGTDATLQLENGTTLNNISWLSIGRGNGNGSVTSNLTLNGNATVTSTNMSAGFNAGNGGNIPKGTITLNGTSVLTATTTVNFAESASSEFTMNINDTATFRQTVNNAGETRVGIGAGSIGTINVNGGTAGFERDLIIGAGGTGRLNLTSGTVNVASTLERWLMVGRDGSSTGEITVDGGDLNLNTNTDIRFGRFAGTNGTSFVTLNGGAITGWTGNGTGGFSGTSVIDLNFASTQAGLNTTFNLNGGTLTIGQIITTNNSGTAAFNFNGGTLRAAGATANFIDLGGAAQRVNVRNGGAIIDTNGVNVTIVDGLRHSNLGGDNAIDGGLTKNGLGTLTLSSNANDFTGLTKVNAGTFALGATASIAASSGIQIATGASFNTTLQSFTMLGGQTVTFDLDGSGAGSAGFFEAGALDINAGSVSFNITGGALDDTAYILASYTSISGTSFGAVSNLPTGYVLDYNYLGANQIALVSAIPEPSAFAALAGLAGLGFAASRRRRRVAA